MNEKIKKFIDKEKEKRKSEICLKLGLLDEEKSGIEYYDTNDYLVNRKYDEVSKKFFTVKESVPMEITDEEYEELLKYNTHEKPAKINGVAVFLLVFAIIMLTTGFITWANFTVSYKYEDYATIPLASGFVLFALFFALYEIVRLLNKK